MGDQIKDESYPKSIIRWQEVLAVMFTWVGVLIYCLRAKTSRKRKLGVAASAAVFGIIVLSLSNLGPHSSNISPSSSSSQSNSSSSQKDSGDPLSDLMNKDRFVKDQPWNSPHNKEVVEMLIKKDFRLQLTGAQQAVANASCSSTATENIWMCKIRFLGQSESVTYRMEANPDTGQIAGQPVF